MRVAVALKKSQRAVKAKARELGIQFQHVRERRKILKEKEVDARTSAGLSAVQGNPKYRHR